MKKAKLLTTLGAVALIGAIGVGSTLAYLSDTTNTVTNTFTVGNVSFDESFGGGLMESKVERVDEGKGAYADADGNNTWTSTGNNYEDLAPGEKVVKDPTIKLSDDSEDAWVFAKVVYNKDYYANVSWNESEWEIIKEEAGTVILAKKAIISENAEIKTSTIFTDVTLANDLPTTTVEGEDGKETKEVILPDITIEAYAIQAAGLTQEQAAVELELVKAE